MRERASGPWAPLRCAVAALALAWPLLALSCPVPPGVAGRVDVAPPGDDAVRMVYLGVGGWIFERGDAQVVAAPLFSNPSFLATGLTAIASDTAAVDAGMAPYDVSGASAILVGHGHYDHLMDVPRVATTHAPAAAILGSPTVANLLGTWSGVGGRVHDVTPYAATEEEPGAWIDVGPGVRVLPLLSHHAPHFDGYTLYAGTVDTPRDTEPRWATEWLEGTTYAYLIDFVDPDGSIAFRIYYQDAVSAAPRGFAPDVRIAARPVDVAIFVPATFDQVDWHPEAFVQNLRPRWVILGHWEDFFVPPSAPTRSITLTDMNHFRGRLERVHGGEHWLPEIGTEFRFPVR